MRGVRQDRTKHEPIEGWTLTPAQVCADLRRMLANIQRVQIATSDPVTRTGAARNADTLTAAIKLIEGTA